MSRTLPRPPGRARFPTAASAQVLRGPPLTRTPGARRRRAQELELALLIQHTHREPEPTAHATLTAGDSQPIPYPAGNPLITCLDPLTRAVVILLCRAREHPAIVARALPALAQPPREVLRRAARLIHPSRLPPAYPNHLAIARALPDPRIRLPLALRASGLFEPADSIARLLDIDRATYYRHIAQALATLRRRLPTPAPTPTHPHPPAGRVSAR